jgi:hypothetical protein
MTASPIPECPEIHAIVTTDHAVHLILQVVHPWASEREAAVAEVERKAKAATAFAASPEFKARYGARIGVLRVQSPEPAPSIVAHLLTEQGIELEPTGPKPPAGPDDADRPACSFCDRTELTTEQAAMTDSGWACPSCFRAWTIKNQPQILQKPRRLRIPSRLVIPLIVLAAALFALFLYSELRRLNSMNNVIRQHLPRE